jgi:biopolymer transport protein ExbD
MALRADDRPLPWPARAFLPGTSMLIKRVAWLKRKGQKVEKSLTKTGRWTLAVVMALVALGVAGIRGPSGAGEISTPVVAADGTQSVREDSPEITITAASITADPTTLLAQGDVTVTSTAANKQLRTFQYVPAGAKLVAVVSPAELLKAPALAKLAAAIPSLMGDGPKLSDVADIEMIHREADSKLGPVLVVRCANPFDWRAIFASEGLETKLIEGREYLHGKLPSTGPHGFFYGLESLYFPDDRTVVGGSEDEIRRIILADLGLAEVDAVVDGRPVMKIVRAEPKLMQPSQFPEFQTSALAVRLDGSAAKQILGLEKLGKDFEANPAAAMFLPLLEHVQVGRLAGEIKGQDGIDLLSVLQCNDAASASDVAKTLDAARTLAINVLKAKQQAWGQTNAPPVPQEQIVQANALFDAVIRSLSEARLTASATEPNIVTVQVHGQVSPAVLAGFAMPAIAASREAAMRTQSMNNMRQLAIAMHNYHAAKDRFPPVAIRDKDGQPLLSWRVEVLPYLGEAELYQQFRFDEPWDSEHNKALIAKMPAVFRDPHVDEKATNSSYFMPTGKGMFGDDEKGRRIMDIKDGTAQTIMLVDAKRDIPWTKPEDIEIGPDPANTLQSNLGGHATHSGGFLILAAFADGHVEIISDGIDPKVLHAFFTVDGGESLPGYPPAGAATPAPAKPDAGRPQSSTDAGRLNVAGGEAALRVRSMNNMRQLALAMFNHESKNSRFPPAAIRDKNGKPLLSWRVAILPFLDDGQALYQQFHLDEPWDSEHNKALIAKMPTAFRDPHEDESSTNASYFMATGKGMFGDDEKGRRLANILDGTAKSIMLVEAKRDIPWTKPEDIEIDPDPAKPLPKFGGHMTNGWAAAFADGHVQFISDVADPKELHTFFTIAGGEVVDEARLNPPPAKLPPVISPPGAAPAKPDAGPPQSSNEGDRLNIAVSRDADGKVVVELNGSRISEDELRKKLAGLPAGESRKAIAASISASKETPYDDVIHVMDMLAQAGIKKLALPDKAQPQSANPQAAPGQGVAAEQPAQPQGPPPRQYTEVDVSLREAPPMGPWQMVTEALLPQVTAGLGLNEDSREVREIRNLAFQLRDEEDAMERELKTTEPDQAKRDALRSQKLKDLDAKSRVELQKILTPEQYAHLKQARLQLLSVDAPEIEEAIGIDAQQKEKLAAVSQYVAKNYPFERGQIKDGMTLEQATQKSADLAAERQKRIDEILTAQQKAKWEEIKGKPPETPQAARPPRGYPQWLIPEKPAKIEFRFAKYRPGEGLQRVELQRPIGIRTMAHLDDQPAVTAEDIAKLTVVPSTATKRDGSPSDYFAIDIAFTEAAAQKMAKLSKEKADEQFADHKAVLLAILVDGKVVSASGLPKDPAKARITGNFTKDQAEQLAKSIRTD